MGRLRVDVVEVGDDVVRYFVPVRRVCDFVAVIACAVVSDEGSVQCFRDVVKLVLDEG